MCVCVCVCVCVCLCVYFRKKIMLRYVRAVGGDASMPIGPGLCRDMLNG